MNPERVTVFNRHPNSLQDEQYLQGTNTHFHHYFQKFLYSFSKENVRIYHRQIEVQLHKGKRLLTVHLADLKAFEDALYERVIASPLEMLKVMEEATQNYIKSRDSEFPSNQSGEWQVSLRSDELPRRLREVGSSLVSKLFTISGIVISATKPFLKASKLKLKCRNCMATKIIELAPGQNPYVPTFCQGQGGNTQKCPNDPFVAMPDSEVIDTQTLKIQENPEDVPTGEIARTYGLIADRDHVSKCVPGDRVTITGIMFVYDLSVDNLSKGYIYVTGIEKLRERSSLSYSQEEEEIFKSMARDNRIKDKIYSSIAPGIFGNQEIKMAIACMLFGGSRKHLPDKTLLRGDVNILLIGDPSTAKSQFLKFVQQTASIAVYTSGKGSSAAGLTASITKDSNTGEFQIEGGALVLADGGIVCIDEFDKMKPGDRVAIHQAMEQQTISVAKAGITTRLNSRTSVLAAANPIYGRYDDFKQIAEQIQMQTTILSRFDCIFVVRDINTPQNNQRIATHILDLHQGRLIREPTHSEIPFETLKKYIKYARAKVNPRLSATAAEKLQTIYIQARQKALEFKKATKSTNSIPITVRQLQAMIRLSESLARMRLRNEVGTEEVDEASRLFEVSTLKSIQGKEFGYEMAETVTGEIQRVEEVMRKRVSIGAMVAVSKLLEQLGERFSQQTVSYALRNMVLNGEFRELKGKKHLMRQR